MAKDSRRIFIMPVPIFVARHIGRKFRSFGIGLTKMDPHLDQKLKRVDIDMSAEDFMGFAFFTSLVYAVAGISLTFGAWYSRGASFGLLGILAAILLSFFSFFVVLSFPKVEASRIAMRTDKEMLSAMRHFMVEVRSGVPLFNAMTGLTRGYGQASAEFAKIVKDINSGSKEIDALNKAAQRNESIFLRRALWQIINSMRAGSDIAKTLEEISNSFAKAQEIQLRKYGQQLNPMTMIYMVFSVIFPSLGITFLIILSSFAGIPVPQSIFAIILIFLVIFQVFFMGFMKSRRPLINA